MVPKHNDDPYNDDDEEEQQQQQACAPKAAKLLKPIDSLGVRMPLKLTSSLTSRSTQKGCVMPAIDFALNPCLTCQAAALTVDALHYITEFQLAVMTEQVSLQPPVEPSGAIFSVCAITSLSMCGLFTTLGKHGESTNHL